MTTGRVSTYDLSTGVMLDFENLITLLDPSDVPLQGMFGADGRTALATGTCFEVEVDWSDDTLLAPRSTLGGAISTADTFITVATGDQLKFSTGDVLLVGAEYLRTTGYGSTTDSLLITRFAGTATTHASGATVVGVGTALAEGSDPENARAVDRTKRYNLTQIFGPHAIQVSGTENVVRKFGLNGITEFDYQVGHRMREMAVAVEDAILYGSRVNDSSNKWRTMGGLAYYITTNVDSTTTQLTETALLTQCQAIYDAGGSLDRAVLGSQQKKTISGASFFANTTLSKLNVDRTDGGRGSVVDYFDCDFGRVSVVLDRWVRKADLFLFARDNVELSTLRPMQFSMLAKTGDSEKGQVLAEKTLKVRAQKHAALFNALT